MIRYGRVGLDLHELGNDVAIAYPRRKVQGSVASFVSRIHHLLHEPHQPDRFWVVAALVEGRYLASPDVAADKVFKQSFEVILARGCATFDGTCHRDVMQDRPSL
jgi:hypothetical protein